METLSTKNAPAAIGPYSQGIASGGMVYVSGQLPVIPETGELETGTLAQQVERAARNIEAVLQEGGSDLAHVVKTTCFLSDLADFVEFNEAYAQHFISNPARECVQAAALPKNARFEISVIAEQKYTTRPRYNATRAGRAVVTTQRSNH